MTPVGALEIGPEGTRFIHFHPLLPLLGRAPWVWWPAGCSRAGDDLGLRFDRAMTS
jgi:hypothetical protein